MKRRTWIWIAAAAGLAAGLPLAAGASIWLVGRATVTSPSGQLRLPGIVQGVDITRDRHGVPHIFATTLEDAYAALGTAHAQDRLWQMELLRRASQGRLAEIFGERVLRTDIVVRTLDVYGAAQRALATLTPQARAAVEAYARGVNAWVQRPTRRIDPRWPPEFLLLRHQPEPWQAADSLAILKMMALSLSTNIEQEITRLTYAAQGLSPAEIEDLMPPQPGDPPLPEIRQLYPVQAPARSAALADQPALLDALGAGASNNWVVSGARTRTGAPLLANDPHLRLSAPSTWYFAHLALVRPQKPAANVVGATLPGVPMVVLGRGDTLAWGFTNTGADVQDLFVEKINPDNSNEYLTPDGWAQFAVEPMEFHVKGGDVVRLERRRTRHGPVLPAFYRNSGAMLGNGHVLALRWTALDDDDTTIMAGLFDPELRSVDDFMQHMRAYVVPMQNMVVADTAGAIGMIAPGRLPVRDPANRVAGRAPVPGWDATYDWKGFVPFEDLPRVQNPPEGAIATANARIVPPEYPYHITYDWDADYRQRRLDELIMARSGHGVATMQAAQLDVFSPAIARLKQLMIAAAREAGSSDAAVLDRLAAWDAWMQADKPEPLIFIAWLRESVRAIWRDDLGSAFGPAFAPNAPALIRLLEGRAKGRDWCEDRSTPGHQTCGSVLARALKAALEELTRTYGVNQMHWNWGPAHFAYGEHQPFGTTAILRSFFNVEVPSPGGPYTLNRGAVDFRDAFPFANRHAASCRIIYDLSNLDGSFYISSTGQSGNPFSRLYRSFSDRWARGGYIRIPTARAEIDAGAVGVWHLLPP